MGLSHSPKIVTNGLVFAYDMGNTNKSWKGAPTTNRLPNATAFTGWSNYYRTLARTSFTTEFGTTGWRFINQPSWSGIQIYYTVPSTGTYTFSAYYKYLGGSVNNNGGSVYVSGWGGNDVATYVNKSLIGVWQRVQITVNLANVSGYFFLISFGGTDSGTTSPDYTSFEVTMPMIESGSFATPFVDGTRSNTQTIIDLTGLNTVTATSLTYNNDNTFSFDGVDDFITIPNSTSLQVGEIFSINGWVYPTNLAGRHGIFSTRTLNNTGSWQLELGTGNGGSGRIVVTGIATWIWESSNDVITINNWYNICYVRSNNSTTGNMYLNGNLLTPFSTAAYSILNNNDAKSLGCGTNSVQFFAGRISNCTLHNRALTAAEVQQNFNALRGRYGI